MTVVRATGLLCVVYSAFVNGQTDYTGKQQRWNIVYLATELVADIYQKYKQTVAIRKEHGRFIAYEVGFIIGQIREKYKLMMELYRICHNRYTKRAHLATPKIREYITVYYFRKQEYILLLALEIDKLVEVLERTKLGIVPFQSILEANLRAREESGDDDDEKQKQLEEAVKSRYREEYLMRKLNSPGQLTTKKRFLNKWPVPGTWSLETY